MFERIYSEYGIDTNSIIKQYGSGLINNTWLINDGENRLILQRINQNVFKNPPDIASNIRMLGEYLKEQHPGYLFVSPLRTISGEEMVFIKEEGYFRIFPFIKNSHTVDVVNSTDQAFEAAKQFGKFTKLLSAFPVDKIRITIPDFHNLPLRFSQFESALPDGNKERIKEADELIHFLKGQFQIVTLSEGLSKNHAFKKRVTHHDAKINNVLFDTNEKGLCVIDLDTVMPGYFISDFGDMMRTYLSPVSEEEKDVSKIEIRDDYFKAIAEGYLSEMKNELTVFEKEQMVYAGKFIACMQAIRFLTDYINNDVYYGSKYQGHNFNRANNQVVLLKKIIEKEKQLEAIIGATL